jgi:hypothetical protein
MVRLLQALPDQAMVIDLAIDGKYNGIIRVGEGLGTTLCSLYQWQSTQRGLRSVCHSPTPTILRRSWHRTGSHRSALGMLNHVSQALRRSAGMGLRIGSYWCCWRSRFHLVEHDSQLRIPGHSKVFTTYSNLAHDA